MLVRQLLTMFDICRWKSERTQTQMESYFYLQFSKLNLIFWSTLYSAQLLCKPKRQSKRSPGETWNHDRFVLKEPFFILDAPYLLSQDQSSNL